MKIELPDFVIAEMFAENLVLVEEAAKQPVVKKEQPAEKKISPPPATEKKKFYLGDNLKHVAVMVDDNKNIFLDDECLQLLTKMLTACKLTLADIALINISKTPVNYQTLKEKLSPAVFLFFGIESGAVELPFTIPNYQVQNYAESRFMFSVALSTITGNSATEVAEKKKLWAALQKIFIAK